MWSSSTEPNSFLRASDRDVAGQFFELVAGNGDAEILAGDVFDVVRFVENHGAIFGDDAGQVFAFHGEVGEEQVVIDDDDVAIPAPSDACCVMKQRSNCGHFWPVQRSPRASILAQAELDSGRDLISARSPVSVVFSHSRMIWKSATSSRPVEHGLLFGIVDFLAAGVVGAAFHVAGAQRRPRCFSRNGMSLIEELLLKILRAGGDDYAAAGENRGDQIR